MIVEAKSLEHDNISQNVAIEELNTKLEVGVYMNGLKHFYTQLKT